MCDPLSVALIAIAGVASVGIICYVTVILYAIKKFTKDLK